MQSGIQWYPGHIAKYERQLTTLLKLVDVVVEVLDARLPLASTNQRLEHKIRHKPTLIILNKSDLADPEQNRRWKAQLTHETHQAILYNAKSAQGKAQVLQGVLALGEETLCKLEARGRTRRPLRVLVAGMPNVGKSTLINSIVGRKKTKTGHRAGVTTQTHWVRIHPEIELMDSPGIIPPQLDNQETAYLLACVSSIGDAAFDDEEISRFLMERIEGLYPGLLGRAFKLPEGVPASLAGFAEARHYKLPGEEWDCLRAAQALLTDFRHARTGRVTLEHAPHHRTQPEG
jgi:ribosome biogenesis GTPase A